MKTTPEAKLTKLRQLMTKSMSNAFDVATALAALANDPECKTYAQKQGKTIIELLDNELSGTWCANSAELVAILKLFPKRADWQKMKLSDMRRQMFDSLRKKQPPRKKYAIDNPKGKRHTVTLNQYEELKGEAEKSKTEIEHLQAMLAEKDARIKQLEMTIANLNETINVLKLKAQRKETVNS